jgi:tryptophan synthase alpha chain
VNRITDTFARLRARNQKALVAYFCVGDPSEEESIALGRACLGAGADILELGCPFSDPTADGPAIARASQRAIAHGGGLDATLRAARALRAESDAPLVLFGYYNPLFVRGEARAVDLAKEAGVDALLVVDLPLGEGAELRARAAEVGLAVVPLVAPTSAATRASEIHALGDRAGFVYYVSVTGVTGAAAAPLADASAQAAKLRAATNLPIVVGFGIDSPEKARQAASHADGVVVGTAIVREIEAGKTPPERLQRVTTLVGALRGALEPAARIG